MASLKLGVREITLWSVLVSLVVSSLLLQGPLILKATDAPSVGSIKNDDDDGKSQLQAAAAQQRKLQPQGQAHYGFVQFSAYRRSPRSFVVLGTTSVAVRAYDAPVHKCEWHSNGSATAIAAAVPELTYIDFDENGALYAPVIVNCTFEQEVGGDERGGTLALAVGAGERGRTRAVAALAEQPGDRLRRDRTAAGRARFRYAFCGPPIHSDVRADWILHWLVYHDWLWERQAHFFFYDVGGLRPRHRPLFEEFRQAGVLTITDVPSERDFPSWYYHQALLSNDCLHRSRAAAADWTFFHDFDEFLHVVPPATLPALLAQHRDAPWITFGSVPVSHSHCVQPEDDGGQAVWPVQRMWWRHAAPECMHPERDPWTCTQAPGRRKYVVNPRKVAATGVHRVAVPAEGGVDLNASVARIHHYHGVLAPAVELCHHGVNLSHPMDHLEWLMPGFSTYVRDSAIAALLHRARAQSFH